MASSSTALDAECIEEDDGLSEPALTEAHVRDIFSHWEAGAQATSTPCAFRDQCPTPLILRQINLLGHCSPACCTMYAAKWSDHPIATTSASAGQPALFAEAVADDCDWTQMGAHPLAHRYRSKHAYFEVSHGCTH